MQHAMSSRAAASRPGAAVAAPVSSSSAAARIARGSVVAARPSPSPLSSRRSLVVASATPDDNDSGGGEKKDDASSAPPDAATPPAPRAAASSSGEGGNQSPQQRKRPQNRRRRKQQPAEEVTLTTFNPVAMGRKSRCVMFFFLSSAQLREMPLCACAKGGKWKRRGGVELEIDKEGHAIDEEEKFSVAFSRVGVHRQPRLVQFDPMVRSSVFGTRSRSQKKRNPLRKAPAFVS